MKTNPDDQAMPQSMESNPGLTKRELFAAMAMQGLLAAPDLVQDARENPGKWALKYADALIESLNQREPVDTPPPKV